MPPVRRAPLIGPVLLLLVAALLLAGTSSADSSADPAGRPITPFRAVVLGVVEGLTEYLPVSSTGHLILASHFLGLDRNPADQSALNAFEVVIQFGAVLAVLGLYRRRVGQMLAGLAGRNRAGLRLVGLLVVAFLPAAVIGLAMEQTIDRHLFRPWPVVSALAAGGVVMILVERWRKRRASPGRADVDAMTFRMALLIGLAQCLAMWPGTSRSMVTILAGVLVGLEIKSAAEFSFLLALPTLTGASALKVATHSGEMLAAAGPAGLTLGLAVSCLVAAAAVRSFVAYLNRRGLAPFGVYRLVLAAVLVGLVLSGQLSF